MLPPKPTNEWITPAILFVLVCGCFLGIWIIPIAFIAWIALGWKLSLLLARHFVTGKESTKNSVGVGIYLIGIAALAAAAILLK